MTDNIFDRLSEEEKNKIEKYILNFSYSNDIEGKINKERASLDYILRFWNKEKNKYLYKMLGNEFIISKQVSIKKGLEEIIADFRKESNDSPLLKFIDEFYTLLSSNKIELLNYKYTLMNLVEYRTLASNVWSNGTINITFPGETKPYKIANGIKVMKVLAKFAEVYNIDSFESFRLRHSQILNQKEMHGELCLSIHPLDFMTMSDNRSDWSSCMSWEEDGDYRQGTVEMMNSKCVLMAYLKSEHDFTFCKGMNWNNKKWRELFIITPDIITSIKGYPYQSDELTEQALNWLRELCAKNLKWFYEDGIKNHEGNGENIYSNDTKNYALFSFYTGYMYNDFNCMPDGYFHKAYISKFTNKVIEIDYSGSCECVWCGEEFNDSEDSNRVICNNCITCICCDRCGAHVDDENDLCEVNGKYYCSDCIDYYTAYDAITGELYDKDECNKIHLLDKENRRMGYVCYVYDINLLKKYASNYFVDGEDAIEEFGDRLRPWTRYKGINIKQLINDESAHLFVDIDYNEPIDMEYLKNEFPDEFKN